MTRTIRIAATQMEAQPAPLAERLSRAERLVAEASVVGANLVVLPELFNAGYTYSDDNFLKAEPLDGPTVTWMRKLAARLNVHLAGSLLLLDRNEIYNALLLVAPDGRMWRYDKNYPWGWERGYFNAGHGHVVTETDLGKIGMMICWDVAHAELWKRYAGQVDLMLISSCPPDASNPTYHFLNGDQVTASDLPVLRQLKGSGRKVFGDTINQQAAWLRVPAVQAVGCGHVHTDIPNGLASLALLLPLAPWLVKYLRQAEHMQARFEFVPGCKIVAASGQVETELTQADGETFTMARVSLPDRTPAPTGPQPAPPVPAMAYWFSDKLLPPLVIHTYRNGLRRARSAESRIKTTSQELYE